MPSFRSRSWRSNRLTHEYVQIPSIPIFDGTLPRWQRQNYGISTRCSFSKVTSRTVPFDKEIALWDSSVSSSPQNEPSSNRGESDTASGLVGSNGGSLACRTWIKFHMDKISAAQVYSYAECSFEYHYAGQSEIVEYLGAIVKVVALLIFLSTLVTSSLAS